MTTKKNTNGRNEVTIDTLVMEIERACKSVIARHKRLNEEELIDIYMKILQKYDLARPRNIFPNPDIVKITIDGAVSYSFSYDHRTINPELKESCNSSNVIYLPTLGLVIVPDCSRIDFGTNDFVYGPTRSKKAKPF